MKLQVKMGTLGEMAKSLSISSILEVSAWQCTGTNDLAVQQGMDLKLVLQTFTWHPPCLRHCNWCIRHIEENAKPRW